MQKRTGTVAAAVGSAVIAMGVSSQALAEELGESVTWGGTLELEASMGDDFSGADQSDIVVSAVEVGVEAKVNDKITAHLLWLHEDDDTEPMEVDEAFITLQPTESWYLSAGRMYIPFGSYASNMISDPLALELGETREAAAMLGVENSGFRGGVYAYNGDSIDQDASNAGEDKVQHFGATVGYGFEAGENSFDMGIDYTSSIADSDLVQEILGNTVLNDYVSGMAFHGQYTRGDWSLLAEYVKSDSFAAGELAYNGRGAEPAAYGVELGRGFTLAGKSAVAAIAVQGTDEAVALGLAEKRVLAAVAVDVYDATTAALEYSREEDYAAAVGGSGNDRSTITVQLAVEF